MSSSAGEEVFALVVRDKVNFVNAHAVSIAAAITLAGMNDNRRMRALEDSKSVAPTLSAAPNFEYTSSQLPQFRGDNAPQVEGVNTMPGSIGIGVLSSPIGGANLRAARAVAKTAEERGTRIGAPLRVRHSCNVATIQLERCRSKWFTSVSFQQPAKAQLPLTTPALNRRLLSHNSTVYKQLSNR